MNTTTESISTNHAVVDGDRPHQSLVRMAALRTVHRLQGGYRKDNPAAVAAVARLRREAGREPHASPTSWGLDHLEALTALREEQRQESSDTARFLSSEARRRHEQREEREDRAVHLAVTLWALHQQSLRDEPMHVPGWSLGRSVRRLAQEGTETPDAPTHRTGNESATDEARENGKPRAVEDVNATVRKRVVRIGTSAEFDTLGRRLREMVLLLRNARIPLDYGLLADQLNRWQYEAGQADVRRSWGRDFHRAHKSTAPDYKDAPIPPVRTPDQAVDDATHTH